MSSVLIIGGDSFIGVHLARKLVKLGHNVFKTTRNLGNCISKADIFFDMADPFLKLNTLPLVDIVFICAGLTSKKLCIDNPNLAFAVNVTATLKIAKYFLLKNKKIIFLSSSAVFHGSLYIPREMSLFAPQSLYGSLKARAELELQEMSIKCGAGVLVIIRPTKVFGREVSLIDNWIRELLNGRNVTAFHQILISPISIKYLIEGLVKIGFSDRSGPFHLSGNREFSFYDFACMLALKIQAPKDLVIKQEKVCILDAPEHALLEMDRSWKLLKIAPQSVNSVLQDLF
jgi:dTDP-4-dehydrorhamnose reductase